jgi:hypothetical protein
VREREEWVENPDTGRLELKTVEKKEITPDVLFVRIRNIITDETSQLWLVGGDVISEIRRKALKALDDERKRQEELRRRTAPTVDRDDDDRGRDDDDDDGDGDTGTYLDEMKDDLKRSEGFRREFGGELE